MATGKGVYNFQCKVIDWIDGDTLDVDVDMGFHLVMRQRVRLWGINAPEIHSRNAEEKAKGLEALKFARHMAPPGIEIFVITYKDERGHGSDYEKYGRWLAVASWNGTDLAKEMIRAGHAKPWDGKGGKP